MPYRRFALPGKVAAGVSENAGEASRSRITRHSPASLNAPHRVPHLVPDYQLTQLRVKLYSHAACQFTSFSEDFFSSVTPYHHTIMAAETADLTKVDSAVSGLSSSPPTEKKGHRRASSSAAGVFNINDLGEWAYVGPPDPLGVLTWLFRKGGHGAANSKGDSKIELVRYSVCFPKHSAMPSPHANHTRKAEFADAASWVELIS